MPTGGDGFYYFSVYLTADAPEVCYFDIAINGLRICTAYSNLLSSPGTDSEATSCSGATYAVQGTFCTACGISRTLEGNVFSLFVRLQGKYHLVSGSRYFSERARVPSQACIQGAYLRTGYLRDRIGVSTKRIDASYLFCEQDTSISLE